MSKQRYEEVLRRFAVGNPDTSRTVASHYDELLVAAQQDSEVLGTVIYRSKQRPELRVIQLRKDSHRWHVTAETLVPLAATEATRPSSPLVYPERQFHFVEGTGEAPAWVDAQRPRRGGAER